MNEGNYHGWLVVGCFVVGIIGLWLMTRGVKKK